jgi:hypothetical protein
VASAAAAAAARTAAIPADTGVDTLDDMLDDLDDHRLAAADPGVDRNNNRPASFAAMMRAASV